MKCTVTLLIKIIPATTDSHYHGQQVLILFAGWRAWSHHLHHASVTHHASVFWLSTPDGWRTKGCTRGVWVHTSHAKWGVTFFLSFPSASKDRAWNQACQLPVHPSHDTVSRSRQSRGRFRVRRIKFPASWWNCCILYPDFTVIMTN